MATKTLASDDEFLKFDALFHKYSKKWGVPWRWIKAVAIVESNLGQARSVARGIAMPSDVQGSKSSDGLSWGLMQVTLKTAREMRPGTSEVDLNNPEISIDLGAQYLKRMIQIFGLGDEQSVFRAYNGGPGFKNTLLGRTQTPIYYAKIQNALAEINERQPGNALEIG